MIQVMLIALASAAVAFAAVLVMEPPWIAVAKARGLVGRDMNKSYEVKVAEAGGLWVIVGVSLGLLFMEVLTAFLDGQPYQPVPLLALLSLTMLTAMIGLLDDLLGWKKGVPPLVRVLSTIPASLPLVAAKYNAYVVHIPILNRYLYLGPLFPLVVVPIGVMGASNAYNMIAGYNGLEASMGIALLAFTAAYAAVTGSYLALYASVIMIAALAAFLLYNRYPARVFPGNTMTYALGAYYAGVVVLGGVAAFSLFLFIPYYLELLLFLRGLAHGVYKENFGRPRPDGSLDPPYDKAYSLTHAMIRLQKALRGRATENGVVVGLVLLQCLVGAVGLAVFLRL